MNMRPSASGALASRRETQLLIADSGRGKLAPPYWEFETVVPKALLALSLAQQLPKLVRVSAPPGYGKTVLLAEIHRVQTARRVRCFWITLDDRDTTVADLAYLLDMALVNFEGKLHGAEPVGDRVVSGTLALPDAIAEKLCSLTEQTIVLIDNLQFCLDDQLQTFIDRLVFASGSNLRIVIASTSIIPVNRARARLEVRDMEIGAEKLRFEYGDIERVFMAAGGRVPQAQTLVSIQLQTEGWPAAVRLLQVLVGEGWSDADVQQRFSSRDHDVAAVLLQRILAGFDPQLTHFMQEMALLREFSTELAVYVTEESQAKAMLDQLLGRNVLVFPLDRGHLWMRMHTLLRQHLLVEGTLSISPLRRQHLLERAARWHVDHGDLATAIDLTLDGSAVGQACHWLDKISRVIVGDQGRFDLYIRWVERLLAADAPVSLSIHVWYVWSLCFTLRYERARRAIDVIDLQLATMGAAWTVDAELGMRLGMMRVVVGVNLDALETAHREALLWLNGNQARDALALATVASGAALAELATGDLDAAQRHMETASGAAERAGSPYGRAWVATVKACIHLRRGEPERADGVLLATRQGVVESVGTDSNAVAVMDFVRARALLDLGRGEEAREAAQLGLRRAALHGVVDTVAQGLSCCVALSEPSGDAMFPSEVLDAVANAYPLRLSRMLCSMRVRQLLHRGRIDEARELARRGMLSNVLDQDPAARFGDVLIARLELDAAGGGSPIMWDRIAKEIKLAQDQGRRRDLVELRLLASYLRLRDGDRRLAQRQLSMAMTEAAAHKLVWPFLYRALQLQPLLAQAKAKDFGLTHAAELALLERLCDAAGAGSAPAASANDVQLDVLTSREVQFLELLELGLSNQQIADRNSLSVETVKWHLKNLYSKLGVKNRAAALVRARMLRILGA